MSHLERFGMTHAELVLMQGLIAVTFPAPITPFFLKTFAFFVAHLHPALAHVHGWAAKTFAAPVPAATATAETAEQDAAKYEQTHGLPVRERAPAGDGGQNGIPKPHHHAAHEQADADESKGVEYVPATPAAIS